VWHPSDRSEAGLRFIMTSIRRFALRLLSFFRPAAAEHALAREIDSHLQLLEDEFVAKGMRRDDARLAARRAFGGVEQAKEHQRDARGFRWLDDSRIDFRLGMRMLVKYPGLSIIGGIGMAAAIAIGTAFFAFFHSYIASTLPVHDGARIIALENWNLETNNEARQSMQDFVTWRDEMKTVEQIGAFRSVGRNLIVPGGTSEPVTIAEITATGFQITHVPPVLGRPLLDSDAEPGAPPVVVIGHGVWQSKFAGDPQIIGRQVRFGNTAHTVVGVMPAGHAFPVNHSYWTPLHVNPSSFERGQGPAIFAFGRLRPGVTIAEAQAELSTLSARAAAAFPETNGHLDARVLPYSQPILDIQGTSMWQVSLMEAMVSLLLVIVAVNVAILIYARTATRQNEIAVRTALGASRRRIVGQLFIEALVLCAGAAAVGLLLARFGVAQGHAIMEAEGASLPYWIDQRMPFAAYVYVAALTLLAAVIAGVLPALQATGRRMQATLKESSGGTGLRLGRTWTALVIAQVALAVAGLPMAIAIGWSEVRAATTAPAFDYESFLAVRLLSDVEPPAGVDADAYRRDATLRAATLNRDLIDRLVTEPAIRDVTFGAYIPGDEHHARIEIDGAAPSVTGAPLPQFNRVAPGFFTVVDGSLLAGRLLTAADAESATAPVVVNRAFVDRVLGGANALGKRIRYVETEQPDRVDVDPRVTHEIVGVVADLFANSTAPGMVNPVIYHPLPAAPQGTVMLLVRTRSNDAAQFSTRLREIASALDPSARLTNYPFTLLLRQQELATRLVMLVLALIVVSVLMLSAAGIYALMSFTVAQRRKEIGIRAAMGADSRQLLRGIFARAAAQLGAGVAVGALVALLVDIASGGEALGAMGYVLLPAMSISMVIVGLVASIGPARRGLRIQPTEALRAE
jgi:putative ABC transport system permease protein